MQNRAKRSQTPWVYRQYRGTVRSYFATTWLVLTRPWRLARERAAPVAFNDAMRFQNVTLVLMFLLGVGFVEMGILQKDDPLFAGKAFIGRLLFWRDLDDGALTNPMQSFPVAGALMGSWWELVPLAIGMYGALVLCRRLQRWSSGIGVALRFERRRAAAASAYFTAVWLVEMILLGAVWTAPCWMLHICSMVEWRSHRMDGEVCVISARVALGVLALAVLPYAALGYGLRIRPRWHALWMLSFPAVAVVLGDVVLLWVHLVVGYIDVALRSMAR